jgi:hypothetical protein
VAYTSAPEKQTYSTEKIPAVCGINIRNEANVYGSLTIDSGMINLIPQKERDSSGKEVLVATTRQPLKGWRIAAATEVARGCYVWEKSTGTIYYFAVCGTKVYTSTDMSTWTAVTTLLTSATSPVGFTEFIDSTNVKKLVLVDGVEGYVFTDNTAGTKITDGQFPTPHLPFPVFLDGYLFLAKKDTGDIYNSDLDDPSAWTAGAFISSELYPDDLTAIVKINNELLAIGKLGCEFFYDAANATASPLARHEGANLPFGCPVPTSIAVNKNTAIFLGNSSDGEMCFKVIENYKAQELPATWLIQMVNTFFRGSSISPSTIRGYFIRQAGELLYVFKFDGTAPTSKAFAYSFSTGLWVQFTVNGTSGGWWGTASSPATTSDLVTFIVGNMSATGSHPFFAKFGFSATGTASFNNYAIDQFLTAGYSFPINTMVRTPILDFGTLNNKTMSRFGIVATLNTYTNVDTLVYVQYSDDDYTTWSTAQTLELASTTKFPFVTQLGLFRQRSFVVTAGQDGVGSANKPFVKYKFFEVDINKGQQ